MKKSLGTQIWSEIKVFNLIFSLRPELLGREGLIPSDLKIPFYVSICLSFYRSG